MGNLHLLPLLVLFAACTQTGIPAAGAPRPDTRIGVGGAFETLVLTTNVRVIPTRDQAVGTPADLWPALARTYTDLGIGIAHVDSARFLLGNPQHPARLQLAGQRLSHWLDCGQNATGVPLSDRYPVSMQVFTQLIPSGTGSEVRSVVTGRATNPTTNDPPVECVSTGRLEKRIVTGLTLQADA
ncbi:MAG: hypothetical protein KY444_11945 [Gemmatimonadetes bacterium]|nr:hypothetical protein [Gemmatimonadota bacterium]